MSLGSLVHWLRNADALFDPSNLRRLIELNLPYRQLEEAADSGACTGHGLWLKGHYVAVHLHKLGPSGHALRAQTFKQATAVGNNVVRGYPER